MSDSSINTHTHLEPHASEQQANGDEAFVVTHQWICHYEPGVPAHIEIPDQPLTWQLLRYHDPGVPREPAQVPDRQGNTKRITCWRLNRGRCEIT